MVARNPLTPEASRQRFILHPYILAVFPSVSLAAGNRAQIVPADFVGPVSISLVVTAASLFVARRLIGERRRAALVVSLGLLLFMMYGHAIDALQGTWIADTPLLRHRVGLAVGLILFAVGSWRLWRTRIDLHGVTLVVTVASIVALMAAGSRFFAFEFAAERAAREALEATPTVPVVLNTRDDESAPDIYYIVLDGYASGSVLERYFDHDASPFEANLRRRGFEIAEDSRSNYPITFLSLASSLNMTYLDGLARSLPPGSADRRAPYRMVADSTALAALRSIGYRTINIDSGWGPTKRMAAVDRGIRCGWISDLSRALIQSTMLRAMSNRLLVEDGRRRLRCAFDELARLADSEPDPFVVVAHILAPHPPYLFDRDGARTDAHADDLKTWRPAHRYLDQLRWVNAQLESLLERILRRQRPAVIMIHGDHGPATRGSLAPPTDELLENAALLDERTGILFALRLPSPCSRPMPPEHSPVNAFRRVFRCTFDADLPPLDDRVFFASYRRPYDLRDVTARLQR